MTMVGNQVQGDDVNAGHNVTSVNPRQLPTQTGKGLVELVHLWYSWIAFPGDAHE